VSGQPTEPDDGDDPFYELVMPFVVCATNGGPYDDAAYCAGWEAGVIDSTLGIAKSLQSVGHLTLLCRGDNRAQIDLLLMKHEFDLLESSETDDGEWITMEVGPR
jgi:hypothetical protein